MRGPSDTDYCTKMLRLIDGNFTVKKNTILKLIGDPNLTLTQHPGFFTWTYDDGTIFRQSNTYVDRLSHLTISEWVEGGQKFLKQEAKKKDQ